MTSRSEEHPNVRFESDAVRALQVLRAVNDPTFLRSLVGHLGDTAIEAAQMALAELGDRYVAIFGAPSVLHVFNSWVHGPDKEDGFVFGQQTPFDIYETVTGLMLEREIRLRRIGFVTADGLKAQFQSGVTTPRLIRALGKIPLHASSHQHVFFIYLRSQIPVADNPYGDLSVGDEVCAEDGSATMVRSMVFRRYGSTVELPITSLPYKAARNAASSPLIITTDAGRISAESVRPFRTQAPTDGQRKASLKNEFRQLNLIVKDARNLFLRVAATAENAARYHQALIALSALECLKVDIHARNSASSAPGYETPTDRVLPRDAVRHARIRLRRILPEIRLIKADTRVMPHDVRDQVADALQFEAEGLRSMIKDHRMSRRPARTMLANPRIR